jgi:hypothetical protein
LSSRAGLDVRGEEKVVGGVRSWLMEKELGVDEEASEALGLVKVVTGACKASVRCFLLELGSSPPSEVRLLEFPKMLGLRIIRDFLFLRMIISCRMHSPASDPSLVSEASRLSIILFKLLIFL